MSTLDQRKESASRAIYSHQELWQVRYSLFIPAVNVSYDVHTDGFT